MQSVVELRQYTLAPGARDRFIDRFERLYVGMQETRGARLLGHFRDLDRPDHFVWMRGFEDMEQRLASLTAIYSSPVWLASRDEANADIINNDDVLLLKPAPFEADADAGHGPVSILIIYMAAPAEAAGLLTDLAAEVRATGGQALAAYVTEAAVNTFPRLPVREGEAVAVLVSRLAPAAPVSATLRGRRIERLRLSPAPLSAIG